MVTPLCRIARWMAVAILLATISSWMPATHASYTYIYNDILKLENGKVLAGVYGVRMSLWKQPIPTSDDTTTLEDIQVLNIHSPNYLGYTEEQTVTSATNGSFSINMGNAVPLSDIGDGVVYLQVDVKPSGTDQKAWQRVAQTGVKVGERRPILLSELQNTQVRFEQEKGTYSGILLTKDGTPEHGTYVARFSLWRSPNVDRAADMLTDGTIRSATSNYLGFNNEIVFTTDEQGRFFLPTSTLVPPKLKDRSTIYVQLDLRGIDEPLSAFDLIDPDADIETDVDRFKLNNGVLEVPGDNNVMPLEDRERLLVTNIPGGTSSRYFELGVGNNQTPGYYEIRARYTKGKVAILRFNGLKQIWEVSSDGIDFTPLSGFLDGTPSENFTIGLGKDKGPFALQFGDNLTAGKISYDPARGAFSLNKNVDFNQNQLLNAVLENRETPPDHPVAGQQYFNTLQHQAFFYNGARWVGMGAASSSPSSDSTTPGPSIIPLGGGGTTTVVQNITNTTTGITNWQDLPLRAKTSMFGTDANMTTMNPAPLGKGTLTEEYDATNDRNFYRWSTQQATMQNMQMVMQWKAPEDFDSMQAIPVQLVFRTSDTAVLQNSLTLSMTVNGVTSPLGSALGMVSDLAGEWKVVTPTITGGPTIHPGDMVTFTLDMGTTSTATVDIWALMVEYMGR